MNKHKWNPLSVFLWKIIKRAKPIWVTKGKGLWEKITGNSRTWSLGASEGNPFLCWGRLWLYSRRWLPRTRSQPPWRLGTQPQEIRWQCEAPIQAHQRNSHEVQEPLWKQVHKTVSFYYGIQFGSFGRCEIKFDLTIIGLSLLLKNQTIVTLPMILARHWIVWSRPNFMSLQQRIADRESLFK